MRRVGTTCWRQRIPGLVASASPYRATPVYAGERTFSGRAGKSQRPAGDLQSKEDARRGSPPSKCARHRCILITDCFATFGVQQLECQPGIHAKGEPLPPGAAELAEPRAPQPPIFTGPDRAIFAALAYRLNDLIVGAPPWRRGRRGQPSSRVPMSCSSACSSGAARLAY